MFSISHLRHKKRTLTFNKKLQVLLLRFQDLNIPKQVKSNIRKLDRRDDDKKKELLNN